MIFGLYKYNWIGLVEWPSSQTITKKREAQAGVNYIKGALLTKLMFKVINVNKYLFSKSSHDKREVNS